MPKLKPLGRYDAALSALSASRYRETSAARKILAILAPLDGFEADNAMELVEEALSRSDDSAEAVVLEDRPTLVDNQPLGLFDLPS